MDCQNTINQASIIKLSLLSVVGKSLSWKDFTWGVLSWKEFLVDLRPCFLVHFFAFQL